MNFLKLLAGALIFASVASALAFRMKEKRWPTVDDVKALFNRE